MNRRSFLRLSGLASAAALAPAVGGCEASPEPRGERPRTVTRFAHPGILQTEADLDRMAALVRDGEGPVATAWRRMVALPTSSLEFRPRACAHVFRSGNGAVRSGADEFAASATAAHAHALQWYVGRDRRYAEKAVEILDAWSALLWDFDGNDAKLLAGWNGGYFCEAAEILRADYPGWKRETEAAFARLLRRVYVPLLGELFPEANGNWDGAIMFTLGAIAVFLEDRELFDRVTRHYRRGDGNGGILKYVWPTGQCEETCRDQGHVQLGLGYFSYAALVAWNQGVDLFGAADDRLALGFKYTAKYMLGEDVPYFGVISPRLRGKFSDYYEAAYQHYRVVKGIDLPYTARALEASRAGNAVSAVWLCRGAVGRLPDATSPAPSPGPHAVDAGASDAFPISPSASWKRVSPGESVQAAVDAAAGGGVVLLEAGVHSLPAPLLLRDGVTVVGRGTRSVLHLAAASDQSPFCVTNATPQLENVTLRNFVIEGAAATEWPQDPNQSRRTRTPQTVPARGGILLRGEREADLRNLTFDHLTIRNCTLSGLSLSGAQDVALSNCDLSDNGGAVVPGPGQHHNLSLNHVQRCSIADTRTDASMSGSGISASNSANLTLRATQSCRNRRHGLAFHDCSAIDVQDGLLEANDAAAILNTDDGRPRPLKTRNVIERLNGPE